ncbi:hypothetical protein JKF63_02024 [Porcisia hertigi]|uniref:Uncharacterized protein n=1 Tax=Porcisia hertigi TaxID=2761500 RepID=A0A836HYR2_9TRYP|nr:hypothetical protein JKF63_02024 [Porcisia hertigi]
MLLFAVKLLVAGLITLMSSVGVWFPIFFVRRACEERGITSNPVPERERRLYTTALSSTTSLWLSLANFVSAGMLLSMALLHFLPESFVVESGSKADAVTLCSWMLLGLLIPAVIERSVKGSGAHSHVVAGHNSDECAHAASSSDSASTTTLLVVLMCFHGATEGILLGFENNVAALLSAAIPLSVHKFCDGLVIGVAMAKELCAEGERETLNCEDNRVLCTRTSRSSHRFWARLFQGQVGWWLLLTPLAMICVALSTAFSSSASPPAANITPDATPLTTLGSPPLGTRISPVSGLAAMQAMGSGSFVYMGLTILRSEELKGMAANAALLTGVAVTGALFYMTCESQ